MFKRPVTVAVVSLLGCAALLIFSLVRVSDQDVASYQDLTEKAHHPNQAELPPGQQQRQLVRKDIWYTSGADRLHFRIESDASTLEFSIGGNKPEMVEQMEQVRALMQEELFWILPDGREVARAGENQYRLKSQTNPSADLVYDESWKPMQQLRYVEADEASYYYTSDKFVADKARLTRFRTAGHELVDHPADFEPTISGTAQSVEFILSRQGVDFHADHLRAKIYTGGGVL